MRRPGYIGPDRFGVLLVLLLAMFVLVPIIQDARLGAVAIGLVVALVLVAALVASGVRPRAVIIGGVCGAVLVVAGGASAALSDGAAPAWLSGLFAGLLVMTTVIVLNRILNQPQVTLSTVSGALSVYLMLGMAFSAAYRAISLVDADAFTEELAGASTYFSFVTLTTLGYGDISPVSNLARSFAMLESVLGSVLLVTLVARFVGNLGQERPPAARGVPGVGEGGESGTDADG